MCPHYIFPFYTEYELYDFLIDCPSRLYPCDTILQNCQQAIPIYITVFSIQQCLCFIKDIRNFKLYFNFLVPYKLVKTGKDSAESSYKNAILKSENLRQRCKSQMNLKQQIFNYNQISLNLVWLTYFHLVWKRTKVRNVQNTRNTTLKIPFTFPFLSSFLPSSACFLPPSLPFSFSLSSCV